MRFNAHCAARRGGDFWAWRDEMIALAESLTVAEIRSEYAEVYRELRENGYTAVGEFHYLGLEEARAAAEAAAEAGIAFVCLYACYLRGGIPRFRQESVADYLRQLESLRDAGIRVGVAPHSVRACPADALRELGRYADEHDLPLHVHADEQPREIEECLAEHGLRPIELLADTGCLGPHRSSCTRRTPTAQSSTCSRRRRARICVCPTTEANLGDGFLPVARVCHRGIRLCIGSDSNVRIDPLEELRELEGIARRQTGQRGVIPVDDLLAIGSAEGAAALGLDAWPDASSTRASAAARGRGRRRLRGLGLQLHRRRAAEDRRPVARPREIRVLGGDAVQAPGAVVGQVAVAPWRRAEAAGSICVPSCHSLNDVIVIASASLAIAARHMASYVAPFASRLHARVVAAASGVVAGPDRRRAEQVHLRVPRHRGGGTCCRRR